VFSEEREGEKGEKGGLGGEIACFPKGGGKLPKKERQMKGGSRIFGGQTGFQYLWQDLGGR